MPPRRALTTRAGVGQRPLSHRAASLCHCGQHRRKYLSTKSLLHDQTNTSPLRHLWGSVVVVAAPAPDGVGSVTLRSGLYADSVRFMQVSRDVGAPERVTAVLLAMATPLNLELAANMRLAPTSRPRPSSCWSPSERRTTRRSPPRPPPS